MADSFGFDGVLAHIEQLQRGLKNIPKAVEITATEGENLARETFKNAQYDGENDVTVGKELNGMSATVSANGESVAFIEYGTGIRYPDNHPLASKFGMIRGQYGHKRGSNKKGWIYRGVQGTNGLPVLDRKKNIKSGIWRSFGNHAARGMFNASLLMRKRIKETIKDVMK